MPASAERPSLPDRWLAAAAEDPAADLALVQLIDACRSGASINEAALLKAIVHYATDIAAHGGAAAYAKLTGSGDGRMTA